MEHTTHDPPTSRFLILSDSFKSYGWYQQGANVSTNSLDIKYTGPLNFEFKDGGKVTLFYPKAHQNGVMFGKRIFRFEGMSCAIDEKNKLKAVVHHNKKAKTGVYS